MHTTADQSEITSSIFNMEWSIKHRVNKFLTRPPKQQSLSINGATEKSYRLSYPKLDCTEPATMNLADEHFTLI